MAFSTDYDNLGSGMLPEGDYECIVVSASQGFTKGSTENFTANMVIREDVPQEYQGKHIFHTIWPKNEPTADDMKVDGLSFKQIMQLARGAELPNGKSYETLDELGNDLVGRCVKVTIEHQTYKGNTSARVKWINKTEHPRENHAAQQTPPPEIPQRQKQGSVSDLADDDLPW